MPALEEVLNKIFHNEGKVIAPLVGGMMNQSYIVSYRDKKYVLYISTEQANEMVDRPLEKANQKLIIDLGITSRNFYFDTEKGIKVNEYIEGSSLDKVNSYDSKKVAELLKIMHQSGKLSRDDYQPFKRFVAYEQEAHFFQEKMEDEYDELRCTIFESKDFLESQKLVLCHNDAQKSNIVRSIDDKYYLIDFEFAANNDPIYDIGTFGNQSVEEGRRLLEEYEKLVPIKDGLKRYALWRIDISLQWYLVATIKHYRGEGAIHGYDFLAVGKFFLGIAQGARKLLK